MATTQRMRLTDAAIARFRPRKREYTVWDTHIAGLGVRVRPCGAVTFIMVRTPGKVPEKARNAPTFRDFVVGEWRDANQLRFKPSTRRRLTRTLASQIVPAFGAKPLDRITRRRVLQWFDVYSEAAPGGANHAPNFLAQILNFAVARGHIDVSPARGIMRNRRKTLARFLSTDEI